MAALLRAGTNIAQSVGSKVGKVVGKGAASAATGAGVKATSTTAANTFKASLATALKAGGKQGTEAAGKEGAEAAIKAAGKEGAQATGRVAGKEGTEAVADAATKEIAAETQEAAARSFLQAGKETAQTAAEKAGAFMRQHYGKVLAGTAVATIAGTALARFTKRNGSKGNIVSITPYEGTRVIVQVSPALLATKHDKLTLSGTDCVPGIDGDWPVHSVVSDDKIMIDTVGKQVQKAGGAKGSAVLHTTFEAQLADTVGDVASLATNTAASGLTGALQGLGEGLGIDDLAGKLSTYKWYILACCLCLLCCCMSAFASMYMV